jgi:hypothetical protein
MESIITTFAHLEYSEILRLLIVFIIILGFFSGCLFALQRFLVQFRSTKAKLPHGIELETVAKNPSSPDDFVSMPSSPKVTDISDDRVKTTTDAGVLKHIMPFTEHNFFSLLRRVIHNGVDIRSKSEIKTQVISSFITTYSTVLFEKMGDWVDTVVKSEGKQLSDISSVKMDITTRYIEQAATSNVLINYKNKKLVLKGVPQIFIDKFQSYHKPQILILVDQVNDIVTDVFHPSWQSKLIAILDVFESIYRCNFIGLNNTIKDLNGELDRFLESEIEKL